VKLEDLTPGMKLSGTVLNVVDFGAFVDIGLSDSGLVHISRLADRFVKDPHEVVGVGDVLTVWVVDVDKQRRRVSLTAIEPGTEKVHEPRRESPRTAARQGGGRRPAGGGRGGEPRAKGKVAGGAQTQARRPARPPQRPKVVTPITKEMEEGKAPLRSFSDLMQFYQKKQTDEDDAQS
jgi:protein Tex